MDDFVDSLEKQGEHVEMPYRAASDSRTDSDLRLLLRPIEAAESLGISRAKLYELLARGELGSVKIAASRRIPTAELHAYVERLRSEGSLDERSAAVRRTTPTK